MTKDLYHPKTKVQVESFIAQPGHALGIVAPDGAGKSYVAKRIMTELLGSESLEVHPHVHIMDAAEQGGIEQVRELQSFLKLRVPGTATIRRAVLIEHADYLRHEAQNALLKMLEEPPQDTVIICTTSSKQSLLTTIASRLQWISVQPLSLELAKEVFGAAYPAAELDRAYYTSEGNVGLMVSLLEKSSEHPLARAVINAKELLKATRYERLRDVDRLAKAESSEQLLLLDALQRLLHAALVSNAQRATAKQAELTRLNQQLKTVLKARALLENKVQPKLAFTWLFHTL
jgi:DNA polymerase III delta prime subunit